MRGTMAAGVAAAASMVLSLIPLPLILRMSGMFAAMRRVVALACAVMATAWPAHGQAPAGHAHHEQPAMPASRESSGTAWLPDASPMRGLHVEAGVWDVMVHGTLVGHFLHESGSPHHRSQQAGSTSWLMVSAHRQSAGGRLGLRTMSSAEPWTTGDCGYPDLLATGELCKGDTIHDRQHPHDLFMELAADYERPLTASISWRVYGGLAGEPALGPPAFLHRPSAASNPIAPISHHWLDSTHISFGVLTGALYGRRWKVDGSLFNGREPDEQRSDLDLGRLDSSAVRVSVNPTERLAFQVSGGHLNDAEAGVAGFPRQDANHITASAIWQRPVEGSRMWSASLAYGLKWGLSNTPVGALEQRSQAVLVEVSASRADTDTWFVRAEAVGKPAHDLHADEFDPAIYSVGKIQGGYSHQIASAKGLQISAGASVSAALLPDDLAPRYEGRVAPGFGVFLELSMGR
jgi:hypothetical protein